jgi:hypothetical protein
VREADAYGGMEGLGDGLELGGRDREHREAGGDGVVGPGGGGEAAEG